MFCFVALFSDLSTFLYQILICAILLFFFLFFLLLSLLKFNIFLLKQAYTVGQKSI